MLAEHEGATALSELPTDINSTAWSKRTKAIKPLFRASTTLYHLEIRYYPLLLLTNQSLLYFGLLKLPTNS